MSDSREAKIALLPTRMMKLATHGFGGHYYNGFLS
jgi:hypothetical protein